MLTIYDAWLDLQDGFVHSGQTEGRPKSSFFPLIISPTSKAGILFSIFLDKTNAEGKCIWPEISETMLLLLFHTAPNNLTSAPKYHSMQNLGTGYHNEILADL